MENDKQPKQRDSGGGGMPDAAGVQHDMREEYRSLSAAIAAVTIPAAHVAKPVVTAWANQKFGQQPKDHAAPPPQQEQQKAD